MENSAIENIKPNYEGMVMSKTYSYTNTNLGCVKGKLSIHRGYPVLEVYRFIAKMWGCDFGQITIVYGFGSSRKTLDVEDGGRIGDYILGNYTMVCIVIYPKEELVY